jgi:hypothetical protein
MTYGLALHASHARDPRDEAELVRGDFLHIARPPHPPLRGTFSPRGEGPKRLPEVNPESANSQ